MERIVHEDLSCEFYPPGAGFSTRAWLLHLDERLAAA